MENKNFAQLSLKYFLISLRRSLVNHALVNHALSAATGLLLAASYSYDAYALTLSEAVNAQLETISLPCQRLLGSDPVSVLTGGLADICARVVPFGSTPQSTGGSAANLSTLSSSSNISMQDGQILEETQIGSQWTLFVTAEGETLDRDVTEGEDGFDSNALRLLLGGTYSPSAKTDIGFAFTTQRHDGDYTNGGNFEADSNGARVLATSYMTDQLFMQVMAGYDWVSSERARAATFEEYFNGGLVYSAEGQPFSDFDYNQTEVSVLAGFNYARGNTTLTPQLGITWLNIDYGTYSESGDSGLELTFHDDERESLQSTVGLQAAMAISSDFGVTIPQLDVHWKHEFADKSRKVNVSFTQDTRAQQFSYDTEAGDRNYVEAGAGVAFVFSQGNQAFIRIQTLLEHDFYESYLLSAGLNIAF
jgi:uncharacterized protein YhjY with autotransporter beta-barrel domain